jgi:hypothetical protein
MAAETTSTTTAQQAAQTEPRPSPDALRAMSKDDLRARRDALAGDRVDADFYRDELALRLEEERIEALFRLTMAIVLAAFVGLAIAVAAIVIAA